MLKAMGIEEEKIEQIIEAHTETVDALKNERDELREKADKLPDMQKELDKLKAAAEKGNSDTYKEKYDALQAEYDKFKGEVNAKETRNAKETALKSLLKEMNVSEQAIPLVIRGTNFDELELDDKGGFKSADKVKENFKNMCSSFIVTTGENKPKPETPPTSGGDGKTAFDAMPLTEKMKFANEHPAEAAEYMRT